MSDNMKLWDAVSKTDPSQTKGFKRGGGFTGTAIKPMWVWKRLTEMFGACGTGWGMDKPDYQVAPGENREVLVYCTVAGWYLDGEAKKHVYGVGGDKVVTHIKENKQYNRPERWESDDEAFKKAYTDALMNAFKFIGVGADVHMGLFDDNKYVQQMEREFADGHQDPQQGRKQPPALKGPIKTRAELRTACGAFVRDLNGCSDADMLKVVLDDNAALIKQVEDEHELYWKGDGADFLGLEKEIERAKAHLMDDSWRGNVLRAG